MVPTKSVQIISQYQSQGQLFEVFQQRKITANLGVFFFFYLSFKGRTIKVIENVTVRGLTYNSDTGSHGRKGVRFFHRFITC